MAAEVIGKGGCLCGAIRYTVRGDPFKSGLCHCTDCRQVTGSAFLAGRGFTQFDTLFYWAD